MATIITREVGGTAKNSPLTNAELDNNFINLNDAIEDLQAPATPISEGLMSASDKTKLDGVQAGAQVNTVASVAGKTGTVTLVTADVDGLDIALSAKAGDSVVLTDDAGTATLPVTAASSVASRLQVLRNNIKQAFADIGNKQANLVSGTNIKTVGGQSLLGAGNVPLGDFLYGASDPDNGGGSDGDVYIQSDGKLWKKASGAWTYTGIQFAAQAAAMLLTGAQSASGVKTFTNRSVHAGAYTPSLTPAHSAAPTFDCSTGNVFEPAAMTSNVTSITLSNAVAGQTVQIRFQQDATGGRTVALPSGAKVSGSVAMGANRVSILTMTYSSRGTRWEGNWMQVPA